MRLSIVHRTAYQYDAAVSFGIQYLRLTPYANASQRVIRWTIEAPGALTRWTDAFGNLCDTLIFDEPGDRIEIVAMGEVDTTDTSGVLPDEQGGVPVETYPVNAAHRLMTRRGCRFSRHPTPRAVSRDRAGCGARQSRPQSGPGRTNREGTPTFNRLLPGAGERFRWSCQDHAHVLHRCCRALDFPARSTSAAISMCDRDTPQPAGPCLAAAWGKRLGWSQLDGRQPTCGTES